MHSFIGINLHRYLGNIYTTVYRKATFTGLYVNYKSNIPATFKSSIVWSLMFCAYYCNTNLLQFHDEVVKIRKILQQNGYAVSLFNNCLGKFLNKIHITKQPVHAAKKFFFLSLSAISKKTKYHILSKNEQNNG